MIWYSHVKGEVIQTPVWKRPLEDEVQIYADISDVQKIEAPGDFQKENWCMDEGEKLEKVAILQDEGNCLYMNKNPEDAGERYKEALGLLEQLLLRWGLHQSWDGAC